MSLISPIKYAEKHGKHEKTIRNYCIERRIKGARWINGRWAIPENTPYPEKNKPGRKGKQ